MACADPDAVVVPGLERLYNIDPYLKPFEKEIKRRYVLKDLVVVELNLPCGLTAKHAVDSQLCFCGRGPTCMYY